MTRSMTTLVVGLALVALWGCAPSGERGTEPGATPTTSSREIEGRHAETDLDPLTAQRWVDRVHMGRGLDPDGKVPQELRTDRFGDDEQIWVSMEVTDAPVGSMIMLTVQESDSKRTIWSEEEQVEAGKSHLGFSIEDLEPGEYHAQVVIGDERVADRTFYVS